jgi:hypothetical protein
VNRVDDAATSIPARAIHISVARVRSRLVPDLGGYFDELAKRGRGGRRVPDSSRGGVVDRVKAAVARARRRAASTRTPSPPSGPARGRRTRTARVTIEYSPRIDGDPDPGEVVWAWVPFEEDPSQGKDRPVVVIGRRNGNLAGIPLTTKPDDREVQVVVGKGDWDSDRRTSYARIWRLLEIDERRTRREGAVLERDRFDEVIAAVDDYYDVVHIEPVREHQKD